MPSSSGSSSSDESEDEKKSKSSKSKSKRKVYMTDAEKKAVGQEATNPLIHALHNLRSLLLRKQKTALYKNNVIENNMCSQAIRQLDKGEKDVYDLEDSYIEAVVEGKERESENIKNAMADIKSGSIKACHLDLILDESEAAGLGFEKYYDKRSPPLGRRREDRRDDNRGSSYRNRDDSGKTRRSTSENRYNRIPSAKSYGRGQTPEQQRRYRQTPERRGQTPDKDIRKKEDDIDERQDPYYYRKKHGQNQDHHQINPPPRIPREDRSPQPSREGQRSNDKNMTCPRCNEKNREFANKIRLQKHMEEYCPLVIRCQYCDQVVEIRYLTDHYLHKCTFVANRMHACEGCGQVIDGADMENHIRLYCRGLKPPENFSLCALCDQPVQDSNAAWKRHLTTECRGNSQRGTGGAGPPQDLRQDLRSLLQKGEPIGKSRNQTPTKNKPQETNAQKDEIGDGMDILDKEYIMPHTIAPGITKIS